ncbi:MAG: hypothetical protein HY097_05545 [Nitrospinae bacterium]|nr:hypothetical protein [Nitrospinota bacterium]MBI3815335.1 hypothetical protein [Nitrospinota bacterium]
MMKTPLKTIPESLLQILAYASLSPSGHNTQPWKVKILSSDELIIQSDPARWLHETDPANRVTFLSLSAFFETFSQASSSIGFETQFELLANTAKDIDVFHIKLLPSTSLPRYNLGIIKSRGTIRSNYSTRPLEPLHIDLITKLSPDSIIYFPRRSEKGKWIAENLLEAIRQQIFDDKKQTELSYWLRFSRKEAEERGDGLTAETLEIGGFEKFFWHTFFSRKTALSNFFRNRAVNMANEQLNNCSGFVVISSHNNSLPSLFQTGRLYQRFGLKVTELGIAHHAMSQLMEENPWSTQLQHQIKLPAIVQFVIRVGYSTVTHGPSIRRPLSSFVET